MFQIIYKEVYFLSLSNLLTFGFTNLLVKVNIVDILAV